VLFSGISNDLAQQAPGTERTGLIGKLVDRVSHHDGRLWGVRQDAKAVEVGLEDQDLLGGQARPLDHGVGVIGKTCVADLGDGHLVIQCDATVLREQLIDRLGLAPDVVADVDGAVSKKFHSAKVEAA
jgi:hypothetical protein